MTPAASYYLSDEAAAKRMAKLVQRIVEEGLRPGESVPVHILADADRAAIEQELAA